MRLSRVMRLTQAVLLLVSAQLVTSCATYNKQQVDQVVAQYQGADLKQLIAIWGVPSKQLELNGQYIVEWITKEESGHSTLTLGTSTSGRHSLFGIGVTLPLDQASDVCIRRATTDQNRQSVTQIEWQGDADFCGELLYSLKNRD